MIFTIGFGGGSSYPKSTYIPPQPSDIFGSSGSSAQNQFGYNMGGSSFSQSNTQANPLSDFGGFLSSGQPMQNTNTFGGANKNSNSLFD